MLTPKNSEATKRASSILAGKTVTPGFTDSHCHIFEIGEREMTLNLEGTNTREDFLAKVKERVAQTERDKWITGRGWIETFWKPPQFPTRADLDKIAPDNPVFLTRADGHAAVVKFRRAETRQHRRAHARSIRRTNPENERRSKWNVAR